MSINGALAPAAAVVAVDVGKTMAAALITDVGRHRLLGPLSFSMTALGVDGVITKARAVVPAGVIRVGVEAAGHYHRPLATPTVWPGWEVVELNPAHVTEQRRVMGRRRVKTDALDLEAMTELLLAGRGVRVQPDVPALGELAAWAAPPAAAGADPDRDQEPAARSAGPLLPGPDVGVAGRAGHQGRAAGRRALRRPAPAGRARLGPVRPVSPPPEGCRCGGRSPNGWWPRRGTRCRRRTPRSPGRCWPRIWRCWPAWTPRSRPRRPGSRSCCPKHRSRRCSPSPAGAWCGPAATAPRSATRPGGPAPKQLYRASGLSPAQYESAGKRRDGAISREGSVELRRALIDLGIGLWLTDPAARRYGQQLRARGKKGGVIGCAMAHRANKIAYALVRDQTSYDPTRWA